MNDSRTILIKYIAIFEYIKNKNWAKLLISISHFNQKNEMYFHQNTVEFYTREVGGILYF